MLSSKKIFDASWSIGLAAGLLAAVQPGRIARAENIVRDRAVAAHLLDAAASEGSGKPEIGVSFRFASTQGFSIGGDGLFKFRPLSPLTNHQEGTGQIILGGGPIKRHALSG